MLSACNPAADTREGQRQVTVFHSRLDAGDYGSIWTEGDPMLRGRSSPVQMRQFLDVVRAKLGKEKATRQIAWRINVTTSGRITTLVNATQFERGDGTETFMFTGDEENMRLAGYHIDSTALFTNAAEPVPPAGSGSMPAPVVVVAPKNENWSGDRRRQQ